MDSCSNTIHCVHCTVDRCTGRGDISTLFIVTGGGERDVEYLRNESIEINWFRVAISVCEGVVLPFVDEIRPVTGVIERFHARVDVHVSTIRSRITVILREACVSEEEIGRFL